MSEFLQDHPAGARIAKRSPGGGHGAIAVARINSNGEIKESFGSAVRIDLHPSPQRLDHQRLEHEQLSDQSAEE